MLRLTRTGKTRRVASRRRSHDRRLSSFLVALSALSLSLSLMLAKAPMLSANGGAWIDVEPQTAIVAVGDTVTLSAQMVGRNGGPVSASAHVRFFFTAGSPNDIHSPGSSSDLDCSTDASGSCSVTYLAANVGIDLICALTNGPVSNCNQAWNAPPSDGDWEGEWQGQQGEGDADV
ncbi:MAG: hypothetical protein M3R05_05810, partial [Chloroflexota bacterium]|nr:hypothetical protein [Chloroflexota bacterium]